MNFEAPIELVAVEQVSDSLLPLVAQVSDLRFTTVKATMEKSHVWISWLLDYLLTTAIRRIKEWRSDAWPIAQRTVHTSTSSGRTAEVSYTYAANGEHYASEHTRSFWFTDSARTYAELFAPSTRVTIRYRAEQPQISILRSQDQGKRGTQLDGL